MKKILILSTLILFLNFDLSKSDSIDTPIVQIEPVSDWEMLIEALIQVESEGNPFAVGKTNDLGILQITPIYVKEVNRILKGNFYFLEDRTDIDKSLEMFEVYQSHHNPSKDIYRAIKIHNPGAGQWYIDKVINEFNKIKG